MKARAVSGDSAASGRTARSEVVGVRQEAPTLWVREQVVRRTRIPRDVPALVRGVPANSRETGGVAERMRFDFHWPPCGCPHTPVGAHYCGEMFAHRLPVGQVDRLALADREERGLAKRADAIGVLG